MNADNPRFLTRRDFVFGTVATGATLVLETGCSSQPESTPTAAPLPSPRRLRPAPTIEPLPTPTAPPPPTAEVSGAEIPESCVNMHMRVKVSEGENLTYDAFIKDIDLLAKEGVQAIRLNIQDNDVIASVTNGEVKFDVQSLQQYIKAIDHTRNKGLNIHLVTNVPGSAADLAMPEYLKATKTYYETLAGLLKGKIKTWQIFNETNVHDYRDYSEVNLYDSSFKKDEYLKGLNQVVEVAYRTIKQADPQTLVTLNLSRWVGRPIPLPGGFTDEAKEFFGALMPYVDALTLDFYPDTSQDEKRKLPEYIADLSKTFNKPVIVGEIGLPINRSFTVKHQEQTLVESIQNINKGKDGAVADTTCVYEMRDEATKLDSNEGRFGVTDVNGKPKSSFRRVIDALKGIIR